MRAAVVIPIYKSRRADLKWYELISLKRCIEVLGHHPIIFMAPEGREFDYLPSDIDYTVETFDPIYFNDRDRYNILMINPKFYERFQRFDYILIYQLDAFVFSDRLEEFCRLGYDYIGAPWTLGEGNQRNKKLIADGKNFLTVGNGGFSLRRVQPCIDILLKNLALVLNLRVSEDFVFSYLGKLNPNEFRVATVPTASRFSVEYLPERYYRKNGKELPFGCHGWQKLSREFYVRVFAECGYDLTPYKHMMDEYDLLVQYKVLNELLDRRLLDRFQRGCPLTKYLPPTEEFFVILADKSSIELLDRLRAEGLCLINEDRIFVALDDKILRVVSNILTKINRRGLLLSIKDDASTVMKLINMGLRYGERFISFRQEYRRHSAELLHRVVGAKRILI